MKEKEEYLEGLLNNVEEDEENEIVSWNYFDYQKS